MRSALDSEHLSDERCEAGHGASHLTAEDRGELLHLLVRRAVVDEHAEAPVAFGHDLRGVRDHGEVRPLTSVPSMSPSRMLKTSVTRQ